MTAPDPRTDPPPDWPARYDKARIAGAKRAQALRDATGVDEHGETVA